MFQPSLIDEMLEDEGIQNPENHPLGENQVLSMCFSGRKVTVEMLRCLQCFSTCMVVYNRFLVLEMKDGVTACKILADTLPTQKINLPSDLPINPSVILI